MNPETVDFILSPYNGFWLHRKVYANNKIWTVYWCFTLYVIRAKLNIGKQYMLNSRHNYCLTVVLILLSFFFSLWNFRFDKTKSQVIHNESKQNRQLQIIWADWICRFDVCSLCSQCMWIVNSTSNWIFEAKCISKRHVRQFPWHFYFRSSSLCTRYVCVCVLVILLLYRLAITNLTLSGEQRLVSLITSWASIHF